MSKGNRIRTLRSEVKKARLTARKKKLDLTPYRKEYGDLSPEAPVCPQCQADTLNGEKCQTSTGKRVRGNGGYHKEAPRS